MADNLAYQAEEVWDELINGEVVGMSPRPTINHNRTAGNIYRLFSSHLNGRKCEAFMDGVDLYLTKQDRFVPDMMVVCDPDKVRSDGVHGAPDLVVEVLSPSTVRYDKKHKKDVYETCGVREYWIVSPGDKAVEQYLLENGKLVLHDVYTVFPDWMLEKMTEEERASVITHFKCSLYNDLDISLEDIFSRVE